MVLLWNNKDFLWESHYPKWRLFCNVVVALALLNVFSISLLYRPLRALMGLQIGPLLFVIYTYINVTQFLLFHRLSASLFIGSTGRIRTILKELICVLVLNRWQFPPFDALLGMTQITVSRCTQTVFLFFFFFLLKGWTPKLSELECIPLDIWGCNIKICTRMSKSINSNRAAHEDGGFPGCSHILLPSIRFPVNEKIYSQPKFYSLSILTATQAFFFFFTWLLQ